MAGMTKSLSEVVTSLPPSRVQVNLDLFNIVSFISVKKTQHSRRQCVASIHQAKEKRGSVIYRYEGNILQANLYLVDISILTVIAGATGSAAYFCTRQMEAGWERR